MNIIRTANNECWKRIGNAWEPCEAVESAIERPSDDYMASVRAQLSAAADIDQPNADPMNADLPETPHYDAVLAANPAYELWSDFDLTMSEAAQ